IDLLIRESAEVPWVKTYVPRCSTCNELLTRAESAPAVIAGADSIELVCPNRHPNLLSLADFLIWNRSPNAVVVWRDDRLVPLPKGGPPPRTIRGIEVAMEWNEGLVGGGSQRFLRIAFPEKSVTEHRLDEIYFEKLLVPGALDGFEGMPIRPEWADVVEKGEVRAEIESALPRVAYRDLALRGWPVPITKVFGGLSLTLRNDLAVGIYPSPAKVAADWKWFRTFIDGPTRREHRLTVDGGSALLPWILESTSGLPHLVAVTASADAQTGVTFRPSRPAPAPEQVAVVKVGVDFGTTHSLLAFYPLARGGGVGVNPETLRPAELVQYVGWLAAAASTSADEATGDFLPPRNYRQEAEDAHLIPSSLWLVPGREARHVIRWDSREPCPGASAKSGFKWDPPGGSLAGERRTYLRELLLLALPPILARAAPGQQVSALNFGFAFPLAFDHGSRSNFLRLLEELGTELKTLTGITSTFVHMSESAACMSAFGIFEHGDVFVVADMGGGTLDLALFTADYQGKTKHYQIGSLRFAGEDGVQALAAKKGSRNPDDRVVWDLRDQIARGQARSLYQHDRDARQVASRLVVYAFEFIRTMAVAHRKNHPEQADRKIRIVLVGNGWRLPDAFAERARQLGAVPFFWELYEGYVERLGEAGLELYSGDPLRRLPSSKHLLVRGALHNTVQGQLRELGGDVVLSRLPAGRSATFTPPG
ncbi:MAG TPA: hypothetical protein VLB12_08845, partial [Gemmatimonadales bacterium]|nr:hypothetical protein [Gemmatimonadales bacterium]